MRDDHIDLCGQVDFTRTEAMPLLEREAQFCYISGSCFWERAAVCWSQTA